MIHCPLLLLEYLPTVVHRICIETIHGTEYYDRFSLFTMLAQRALQVLSYMLVYRVTLDTCLHRRREPSSILKLFVITIFHFRNDSR